MDAVEFGSLRKKVTTAGNFVMNKPLQNIFLYIFRVFHDSGLLKINVVRKLFYLCYELYKQIFEAGPIHQLRAFIKPGTIVIDVGANVGFFTVRFANWLANTGGKVIALEPESTNFQQLAEVLRKKAYNKDLVEALPVAAAEECGTMRLAINPFHPGDHHLDQDGIPVDVVTIDSLLNDREWPRVSLIKVDVQGAELRVLQGAIKCLAMFKPVLFIEVDEDKLNSSGTSAHELFAMLSDQGYKPYRLHTHKPPYQISCEEAIAVIARKQYEDFLFIADPVAR